METRDRILDAAAELMRTRGIVRTTTKEIAKAAGFSEATLYKHFRDKEELLLRVLGERMPGFARVEVTPGEGRVEDNVWRLMRGALDFYRETFPMMGPLLSEPRLMAAHHERINEYGAGPRKAVDRTAAYFRAELDLGRLPAGTDPDAAAALVAGVCFQQAFFGYFAEGAEARPVPDETVTALARTLTQGLLTPA
ncbi:TetR/AcrR family transcriptional regulator [Actinoallomurus bryophytorum]|uniref:TetR family transcriptional regulator n=1 Tax=Actinoallomurus bryophytorum TaxID=1490222 RepID=A0A543CBZ6_9ACTN|nr:TetR/AcrR family transcriptional regulator [Actinoallomurus bryophytorum]TQL94589.1 TetR family transcriptional regulator [Actinoallomurus bryophytorum]